MPLQLKITSKHCKYMGDDCIREYHGSGGTIGRSLKNDWILPDQDRYISGKHATIDFQSGAYYLADTSSNGVYINDEEKPVGKGNPRRLFNGDRLRMGDFEFLVTLDEGEDLEIPANSSMSVVPNHMEQQLVEEANFRSSIQMLDEEEITGGDALVSFLKDPGGSTASHTLDEPAEPDEPAPKKREPNLKAVPGTGDLFQAFLDGARINRQELDVETDPLALLNTAGKILREYAEGVNELLAGRSELKSRFQLDQTTVLPQLNNPVKLAGNSHEALLSLLNGSDSEYLGAVEAIKLACEDIQLHQTALFESMAGAHQDFMSLLNPDELQHNFDRNLSGNGLFKKMNQVKYWQMYSDFYGVLSEQGAGGLPERFNEEFVRCYEKFVADSKRNESSLYKTQAQRLPKKD